MSANNTTEIPESLSEADMIAWSIQRTYLWILSGIGIPANILVILVVLSMQRKTSGTFLLAAMSFFDACALVLKVVIQQLFLNDVINSVVCRLDILTLFFCIMSNWTLIFLCIERSVAACSVRKNSNNRLGLPRCVFTLIASAVAFLSFLLPLYLVILDYSPEYHDCIVHPQYVTILDYVSWAHESLVVIIPYAVLILLAVILALVGCLGQRRRAGYHSIDDPITETVGKDKPVDERFEKSLTLMTFSAAIFVFLFTLPSFTFFVCAMNGLFLGRLLRQVKFILFDSTSALKFFIYLLVTDVFRKYFCKVCCGAKVDLTKQETITVE